MLLGVVFQKGCFLIFTLKKKKLFWNQALKIATIQWYKKQMIHKYNVGLI